MMMMMVHIHTDTHTHPPPSLPSSTRGINTSQEKLSIKLQLMRIFFVFFFLSVDELRSDSKGHAMVPN